MFQGLFLAEKESNTEVTLHISIKVCKRFIFKVLESFAYIGSLRKPT